MAVCTQASASQPNIAGSLAAIAGHQRADHRRAEARQQPEHELEHDPDQPDRQQGQQSGEEVFAAACASVGRLPRAPAGSRRHRSRRPHRSRCCGSAARGCRRCRASPRRRPGAAGSRRRNRSAIRARCRVRRPGPAGWPGPGRRARCRRWPQVTRPSWQALAAARVAGDALAIRPRWAGGRFRRCAALSHCA